MDGRIKLTEESRIEFFEGLAALISIDDMAKALAVSSRTVRDWRRGRYTIPSQYFAVLLKILSKPHSDYLFEEVPLWWHTGQAGRIGGKAYIDRYKTLGTAETRIRGGRRSYDRRKELAADIFTRKVVKTPDFSTDLAEFIGIMIGDGSIGAYQASVALDAATDKEYGLYVTHLVQKLFGIKPVVQLRKESRCIVLVMSSVVLTDFLVQCGLPRGHKLKAGLDVPSWIFSDATYMAACARGIFDTDGSVFQETHKYKTRTYSYPRLALVSMSPHLLASTIELLKAFEIYAKIRNNRCVSIERFTDIEKYFTIIGSSNPKHLNRWAAFGGVG